MKRRTFVNVSYSCLCKQTKPLQRYPYVFPTAHKSTVRLPDNKENHSETSNIKDDSKTQIYNVWEKMYDSLSYKGVKL